MQFHKDQMGGWAASVLELAFAAVLAVSLAVGSAPAGAQSGQNVAREAGAAVPGQYIVVFQDNAGNTPGLARALARGHGLGLQHVYEFALKGFSATVPAGRLAALARDSRVAYIEQDVVVTANGQEIPTGITRIGGEFNVSANIDGLDGEDERVNVDVAVIDTGILATHPDLNVVAGTNCARGGPRGKPCEDGHPGDGNGHGTHVAGTIGALDNDIGVVGVAPGARLWPVQVLGSNGSGYMSWLIAGLDWVAKNANHIEVANMSIGCGCYYKALDEALSRTVTAGVTVVVSAGNEAMDGDDLTPSGNFDVISVSALADFDGLPGGTGEATCRADEDDSFANFSNYGSMVDLIAPGVCILSTYNDGGYAVASGTSMASPHVAGAAALLAAVDSSLSPGAIKTALRNEGTADWDNSDDGDTIKEPLLSVGSGDPNAAPVVSILAPAEGDNIPSAATIDLSASAIDAEDGDISSSVSWSSDPDGKLGNGLGVKLSDGSHVITASATDDGGKSGTNAITITVGTPQDPLPTPSGTTRVSKVDNYVTGSRKKTKMNLAITILDENGTEVAGASVSMRSTHDLSDRTWSGTGTTNTSGVLAFKLINAPTDGCYDTKVSAVSADGHTWDGNSGPWQECEDWSGLALP